MSRAPGVPAIGRGGRGRLLLCNALPLTLAAATVLTAALPWASPRWRLPAAVGVLYLLPPLLARATLAARPMQFGRIAWGAPDFYRWWLLLNLQVLYCRFPALEELLRLAPGLYSAWLRLWGARIGRLTYWAAGTRILDRPFLDIGDDVIFGAAVRLNAHVIARNAAGEPELLLAPIRIGDRAIIGGYSLLTAGTEIAPDEATRAFLVSPPFSRWRNGRRVRDGDHPASENERED